MADNSVFITGVADGAFEKALGDLPPWATEDTASSIEGILRKTLNLQTKALSQLVKNFGSGNLGSDSKKLNDELDKLVKNFHEENIQFSKNKKTNKEKEVEDRRKKKRWSTDEDIFNKKIALDGLIIKSGYAIRDVFEKNVATYDSMVASGINVMNGINGASDGFDSIRQLTAITGVRFTELAASMEKYSSSINAFGIGKFAKTVGMASVNLNQFGFSSKESADLLGAYLSVQQNVTDISKKTAEETNSDLQKFGNSVFRLSLATGISRTAIIANAEAISKSTEANLLAGQIGQKSAESMTTFLASFKDQNMARQILKLLSDPIKPLNESFMNLTKVGMGGFAQSFTTFTKSLEGMPEETKQQALKSFVEAHRGEFEQQKQRLALLKQAGVAEAGAALDLIVGLTQQADTISRLNEADIKRIEATNVASKALSSEWEKLKSTLQGIFAPTIGMLNFFTTTLEYVNKAFKTTGDFINEYLGPNSMPMIGLGIAISGLTLSILSLPKLLKMIFGSGSIGKTGAKGIAESATSSASKGGGLLSGIGKGIAGIGKGIGTGIGKILEGLADGLIKLGNPKVLLGVLSLAGIAASLWVTGKAVKEFVGLDWETLAKAGVALVGLGVAGAAAGAAASFIALGAGALGLMGGALWIIGKAIQAVGTGLDDFAKSMQEFGKIDGNNLLNVAKGIAALASSVVLFTGSNIISSVGGAFSTLLGGFSKLFGDGSIIDQLKSFATLGTGLQLTLNAFNSISTNLSSLSSTLGSFSGLDTLKSIVTTINSIDIVKALAFGAIGKFSGISLPSPTPTTGVAVTSTPKSSTLNSPSAVSTNKDIGGEQAVVKEPILALGSGIEKPVADSSINTALGYQSSLLEQLLLSTNSLVSVNKDILKYSRVNM